MSTLRCCSARAKGDRCSVWTALWSEVLKYRRSAALYVAMGLPLFVVIVITTGFIMQRDMYEMRGNYTWFWFEQSCRAMWGLFVVSMLATLVAALTAHMETGNHNWKLILAQPVERIWVYTAKLFVCLGLLLLSALCGAVATWIAGQLIGLPGDRSLGLITANNLVAVPAALPVLGLQLWLSFRSRSFFLPLGIALAGNFVGLVAFEHEVGQYLPWSFPITLLGANGQQALDLRYLGVACLIGLALCIAGAVDFRRKEVT